MKSKMCLVMGYAALAAATSAANAQVPGPLYSAQISADYAYENQMSEETSSSPGMDLSASEAYNSVSLVTNPSVPAYELSGSSSVEPDYIGVPGGTTGYADLKYYYQVLGANGPVPVDISYYVEAHSSASGPNSTNTGSEAIIEDVATAFYSTTDTYSAQSGALSTTMSASQSHSGTFLTTFTPGYVDSLELYVMEQTEGGAFSYSSAEAYIDPEIYIDPTYLAAHPGATLQISSGIGNVGPSAAPEPSAWALMLAGVGIAGAGLRRRRRPGLGDLKRAHC